MMSSNSLLKTILRFLVPAMFFQLWVDEPGEGDGDGTGDEPSGEVVGTGNEARLAFMDAINDRNDEARADELANVNDDDTTEPFVPERRPQQMAEDDVDGQGDVTRDEPPALPKIKVNGEEVELTPELIAKAQKIASADKYLEDASKARKAVTETPPASSPAPQPPQKDVVKPAPVDERALVRAIQMGTEEEALAALQTFRSSAPQINLEDIGRIADERLEFKSALSWFEQEYADLVSDPQLHNIVLEQDDKLVKAGDKRSYRERYEAIGNDVRAWRDEMVKKFTPTPPAAEQQLQDKLQRKASAPKAPVLATAKKGQQVEQEDQEESTSSVIANMAKARGGPQWARN